MKTLLLNAPVEDDFDTSQSTAPLGLLSIAAFLREKGIDASLHNLALVPEPWESTAAFLKREQADFVGISFYTSNRINAYRLSRLVREILPNATVAMGGHHASYMAEQLLDEGYADVVVIGEGEQTTYELLTYLAAGRPLDEVAGLAFRRDGRNIITPRRDFIADLDALPFLYNDSYTDLDTYSYHLSPREARAIAGDTLGQKPWEFTHFPLISTRGCPFSCAFCASTVLGGGSPHYWRAKSPELVVDELQYLYENHNCRFVSFVDNSFNIQTNRVVLICHEILRRGLKVYWDCAMRANPQLNPPQMLELMKRAGCWKLHYGIESGSDDVLANIDKRISSAQNAATAHLAKSVGLKTRLLFMVGNPGESDESIRRSAEIARECSTDDVMVNMTVVYPGTGLYAIARNQGWITDEYWLTDAPLPKFPAGSYLQSHRWFAQLRFMSRPATRLQVWAHVARMFVRQSTGLYFTLSRGVQRVPRREPLFDRR